MFSITLKDQKLPGYSELITIEVNVAAVALTAGNLQAQWSIDLPQSGAKLAGAPQPSPLFKGNLDMPPPPAIMAGLEQFFKLAAGGLVANLSVKANAEAKADRSVTVAIPVVPVATQPPAAAPVNTKPLEYPS